MTKGYTNVTLIGGTRNGEIIEDVPLNKLPKKIEFRSETYFAKSPSGGMQIMKGDLTSNWDSFSIDIYSKAENNKNISGTSFDFVETAMIERCSALTKKKTQCLKPAIHGKNYCCETHKKSIEG